MKPRNFTQEVNQLLYEAYGPSSPETINLLLRARTIADESGDIDLSVQVRERLICADWDSGYAKHILESLAWLADRVEAGEASNYIHDLPKLYTRVVRMAAMEPDISLEQLHILRARERHILTLCRRPTDSWHSNLLIAIPCADHEGIASAIERSSLGPQAGGDCPACQLNECIRGHLLLGQVEHAMSLAKDIEEVGGGCNSAAAERDSMLLIPLAETQAWSRCLKRHRQSCSWVVDEGLVRSAARHVEFLVVFGRLELAERLLSHLLTRFRRTMTSDEFFEVMLATRLLAYRLAEDGRIDTELSWPSEGSTPGSPGRILIDDLKARAKAHLHRLAERFDQRNGNTSYGQRLLDHDRLNQLKCPPALADRLSTQGRHDRPVTR